jgi:flagellin
MAVINTNVKALFSQMALTTSGRAQQVAMQQLSTGKRINSARDDAAGMAIATRMTHQIRSLNQAVRNAGDAITLIQTAEGATNEITDMMQRMRELAVQAVNDTNDNAQRSYLDLEFQQLKQQIVQISNNTEWNGFPVLNGTAGQQVGEMPVYKATSQNQSGSVFIDPTTTRTITGTDAGEKISFTLSGAVFSAGKFKIGDQSVEITQADADAANAAGNLGPIADKVKTTFSSNAYYGGNSGRSVDVDNGTGKVTITFNSTDGGGNAPTIDLGSTGLSKTGFTTERAATTAATEVFANNGKFLQSGALRFNVDATGQVNASFLNADNKTILMRGQLDAANGKVTFDATNSLNSSVISDNLTYTLRDSQGNALDLSAGSGMPRNMNLNVDVAGSIPSMRADDLIINGVRIGPSLAADDTLSPRNNANGSAIAKAAAINRMAVDQGISQGESQSITISGTPMPGTFTVAGVSVVVTAADKTPVDVAQKIAAALQASAQFGASTNRNVTYAQGSPVVNIDFPVTEGNVAQLDIQPGATGLSSVVNNTAQYMTSVPGTGVFAKVNENVFTGKAMTGSSVVSGVVEINGFRSANITSVLNNPQATRANVVRAINLISDQTGVKAIDTGSEGKGVTLVAVDGRNIEVRFDTSFNSNVFGDRVGLNEGVQSSTISLESKIPAPVVLGSAATGDISRVGLVAGNYSKNQAVLNTRERDAVQPALAQVESVNLTGTVGAADTASILVNGKTYTSVAGLTAVGDVRTSLITQINNDKTLGVIATSGRSVGEILLTAKNPGSSFTMSTTQSASSIGVGKLSMTTLEVTPNTQAQFKNLGNDDLTINGIKIPPSSAADDIFSNTVVSSSDPASSAIALAAAVNKTTSQTGVRAEANPVLTKGTNTSTGVPATGKQYLYVNGIKVGVDFVRNESQKERCDKVVDAINHSFGETGVKAENNGKGVTLSSDGRNLSIWYDSSVPDLSAANFGLDQGGAVSQISKIKVTSASDGNPVSVMVNGVNIPATASTASGPLGTAQALSAAINLATTIVPPATAPKLTNVIATVDPTDNSVVIKSTVPGSGFDLRGATVAAGSTQQLDISTVAENDIGKSDVTAVNLSDDYKNNVLGGLSAANNVKTLYGTLKFISDAPMLPAMPGPDGLKPSSLNTSGDPIVISSGADGFGAASNFSSLGFNEGNFGGRASEDMDPPKVGRLAFQVGASANQIVTIDLADFGKNGSITGQITGDVDLAADQRKVKIDSRDGATAVLNLLDAAMDKVNATRATMGAVMNRLDHVINNLTNVSMNMSTSRSQIEDADYASSSTELAKTQIMQQAATAVLAQANTSQQTVLKLLGG